ncbi:MAG: hypothetical protein ACRET4_00365, partial [Steroidobacteraceae bacterium]
FDVTTSNNAATNTAENRATCVRVSSYWEEMSRIHMTFMLAGDYVILVAGLLRQLARSWANQLVTGSPPRADAVSF